MRTLFISETIPYPLNSGRNQRVFHLLKAVARVSEVTLACATPGGDPCPDLESLRPLYERVCLFPSESFGLYRETKRARPLRWVKNLAAHLSRIKPSTLDWWRSSEGGRLVARLTREQFDLIWAERLLGLGLLPPNLQTRVVVDLDDLEHRKLGSWIGSTGLRWRLPLDVMEFFKLRRFERSLPLWGYDLLVCSELDRQIIGWKPNVIVVPNGTDVPPLRPAPPPESAFPIFLFVGSMGYFPNIEAVQFFTRRIFPHIRRETPEAQFWVVGADPAETVRTLHDGKSIIVTGGVPEVQPYLRDAAVVVVPYLSGAGTRIKILEAMAHCRPIVSTRIGAEGLEVRSGRHLLIEDDPIAFAQACLRLLRDPDERQRLTSASYELVRERYDWKYIEHRVQEIVAEERMPQSRRAMSTVPISRGGRAAEKLYR